MFEDVTLFVTANCDVRSDICSYVVSTTPLQLNCKIQSSANISWSWEYVNPSAYFGQRKYGNIFCFNWYSVLKVTSGNARGTTSHMVGKCPINIECFQMAGIALDICVLGGWCSWWKTIPRSGTKNSKSPLFFISPSASICKYEGRGLDVRGTLPQWWCRLFPFLLASARSHYGNNSYFQLH